MTSQSSVPDMKQAIHSFHSFVYNGKIETTSQTIIIKEIGI